jgi:hypothetical protein
MTDPNEPEGYDAYIDYVCGRTVEDAPEEKPVNDADTPIFNALLEEHPNLVALLEPECPRVRRRRLAHRPRRRMPTPYPRGE